MAIDINQLAERLAEAGVDLSAVDLGKLDLSAIDVSRLSPDELLGLAARLNVDVSKLDMAAIASKMLGAGGLGGLLGGLFGGR